jgi:hypothetical protein
MRRTEPNHADPDALRGLQGELRSLYLSASPAWLPALRDDLRLSNPVLMNVPNQYLRQPARLLVVGQETGPRRWARELDVRRQTAGSAIDALMLHYTAFRSSGDDPGHFWRAVRLLEGSLGIEAGSAAWTNLNKCDLEGVRPRGIEAHLGTIFPCLLDEVRLLRPDAVVFMTGPTYDELIQDQLGAVIERVGRWPTRDFARVLGPHLPRCCFRTYHPNFMLRFRKELWPSILRKLRSELAFPMRPGRSRRSRADERRM